MDIEGNSLYEKFNALYNAEFEHYKKNIDCCYKKIQEYMENSPRVNLFSDYSSHGLEHSLAVMNYMAAIIGDNNRINIDTLYYLIMVSLCHDLGMIIIKKEDIDAVKSNEYISNQGERYSWEKVLIAMQNNETEAQKIIIRETHHYKEILKKKLVQLNLLSTGQDPTPEWDFIITACFAHGLYEDQIKKQVIDKVRGDSNYYGFPDIAFIVSLLRICDLLDISRDRLLSFAAVDQDNMYQKANELIQNIEIRSDSNATCISTDEPHSCCRIEKQLFVNFSGHYDEPNYLDARIYLIDYFNQIRAEIETMDELMNYMRSNEDIRPNISSRISFSKPFNFETVDVDDSLIIQLMSERTYGDKKYAFREIIQNALDACEARRERTGEIMPKIEMSDNKQSFSITDNGIGMTEEVIRHYFLKAGKSYYDSKSYRYSNHHFFHAGFFGVGFFSYFMLADVIKVATVSYKNSHERILFECRNYSLPNGKYVEIKKERRSDEEEAPYPVGTTIEFKYNSSAQKELCNFDLKNFIKRTFILPERNRVVEISMNGKNIEISKLADAYSHTMALLPTDWKKQEIDITKYLNHCTGFICVVPKEKMQSATCQIIDRVSIYVNNIRVEQANIDLSAELQNTGKVMAFVTINIDAYELNQLLTRENKQGIHLQINRNGFETQSSRLIHNLLLYACCKELKVDPMIIQPLAKEIMDVTGNVLIKE